jgi:hypothetical protein
MSSESDNEESQRRILRALIAETQGPTHRFDRELESFADSFSHSCGHNRLERMGLRWSDALSPEQSRLLATDRMAAAGFAPHLHRALMRHLLPTEDELETLPKLALSEWAVALRMGIQGVLCRRAYLGGHGTGNGRTNFSLPDEAFLRSIQPTLRGAADAFFLEWTPVRVPPVGRAVRAH